MNIKANLEKLRKMTWGFFRGGSYGRSFVLQPGSQFNYQREVGDAFRNSVAYVALTYIARNMVKPELCIHEKDSDAKEGDIEQHPMLMLLSKPNPYHDYSDLWHTTMLQYATGNAYWLKVRDRTGVPVELYPVPTWMIEPWSTRDDQLVEYYRYRPGNGTYELAPSEVVHFRHGSDPDNPMLGLSPFAYLMRELFADNAISTMVGAVSRNMGIVGLLITPKAGEMIDKNDMESIRESATQRTTGDNSGRPLVLSGAVEVQRLGWSVEEMGLSELRNAPTERIIAALGLNAMALGLPSDSKTYANYAESVTAAWKQGIIPIAESFAESLYHQLLPDFEEDTSKFSVEFEWDEVEELQEDQTARWKRVGEAYQIHQIVTRAEAREILGLDVDPKRDDVFFPEAGAAVAMELAKASKPSPVPGANGNGKPAFGKPGSELESDDEDGKSLVLEVHRDPFGVGGVAIKAPSGTEAEAGDPEEQGYPDEDNTFSLPDGAPIRKKLQSFFRKQASAVLGSMPSPTAEVPSSFDVTDWTDKMTSAMTPLLSVYWDGAGKRIQEQLGLDPDAWEVTDPNLRDKIEQQAFDFASSTNASTTQSLQDAHASLREQLIEGVLEKGEAASLLTQRVQVIFTGLTKRHANLIALTETSRAVHQASLESARQSEVVSGKKWLLSANACPVCHSIANEVNKRGIGLDDDFAVLGSNETYKNIKMPPAHPRCRCSTTFVIDPEYLTSLGIDPAEVNGEVPVGDTGEKPAPLPPPRPVSTGTIQERLAGYTEGDRKIAALAKLMQDPSNLEEKIDSREKVQSRDFRAGRNTSTEDLVALQNLRNEVSRIRDANVKAVLGYLKVPEIERIESVMEVRNITNEDLRQRVGLVHERIVGVFAKRTPDDRLHVDYREIKLKERAYFDGSVSVSSNASKTTIAHEIGHAIENTYPGTHRAASEFLSYRRGNEELKPIGTHSSARYGSDEVGVDDMFGKVVPDNPRYVGKHYLDGKDTEIVSMGLQVLMTDPHRLILNDPEYGKLMMGILDGTFR